MARPLAAASSGSERQRSLHLTSRANNSSSIFSSIGSIKLLFQVKIDHGDPALVFLELLERGQLFRRQLLRPGSCRRR